ncbi:unnamed protein product, partial [Allacma fusca]
MGMYKMGITIG